MSNLTRRIITAFILGALVIGGVIYLPTLGFALFTMVFVLFASWEWTTLSNIHKVYERLLYVFLIFLVMFVSLRIPLPILMAVGAAWWVVALWLILRFPTMKFLWNRGSVPRAALGIFVLIPCWISINVIRGSMHGVILLLYFLALIWLADIAAYFVGKRYGKTPLAPEVSPKKTWEGLFGGVGFGFVFALVASGYLGIRAQHYVYFVITSVIVVLISVIGDLFESMLKREVGIKDSGTLLPGHGGILDRIDSLTAAAPWFALGIMMLP